MINEKQKKLVRDELFKEYTAITKKINKLKEDREIIEKKMIKL